MKKRRRKLRPRGVAILVLLAAVPVIILLLVFSGNPETEPAGTPAETRSVAAEETAEKPAPSVPVTGEVKTVGETATKETATKEAATKETATRETAEKEPVTGSPVPTVPATSSQTPPAQEPGKSAAVLKTAESLIGTPWVHGGAGPKSFDNSGFIWYVFRQNGVEMPRATHDIIASGTAVSRADLKPGDVVVFTNAIGGKGDFVGIYAGNDQFIASFNTDTPTGRASMAPGTYWGQRFIAGRRVV